jgi:hypothetical protein
MMFLSCCVTLACPLGFAYSSIHASSQLYSLNSYANYFHKLKVNIVKQLQSTLASQQCFVLSLEHSQILSRNGILIFFLAVLTYKCAYDDEHMMVTCIPLDAAIRH